MNDVLKSLTIDDQNGEQGHRPALRFERTAGAEAGRFSVQDRRPGVAGGFSGSDERRQGRVEVRRGDDERGRSSAGAWSKADDKQPEREQLVLLLDSGELRTLDLAAASSIRFADPKLQAPAPRLPDRGEPIALQRQAQHLHRFVRRQGAPDRRQLHDPDAGLEIQLPADLRRQGRADAGRLGHHRQHHRRRLDQRAAGGGVGPAGVVHQQVVRAEVRAAADGGTAGGSRGARRWCMAGRCDCRWHQLAAWLARRPGARQRLAAARPWRYAKSGCTAADFEASV